MNITLSFEATAPCIQVSLPDETAIFDMLTRVKQAVQGGKRQVVHILLTSESIAQFPRHGIIDFNSMEEFLSVEAEGPWWLYAQYTRASASNVALKMICDVAHVLLTVDTVIKE